VNSKNTRRATKTEFAKMSNRRKVRTIDYLALQQSLRLQKTPATTSSVDMEAGQGAGEEMNGNGICTAPAEAPPPPPPVPPIRLRREQSIDEDVAR